MSSKSSSPEPQALAGMTPDDVSDLLRNALLQALSTSLSSLPASNFPIPASTFWSSYIIPARPTGTDAGTCNAKASTHRSVKAFLKASAKEGLIKLKDNKIDVAVYGVYPTHPDVIAHKPYRTAKEDRDQVEREQKEADKKQKREIRVAEYWQPSEVTSAFFAAAQQDISRSYTISELEKVFDAYVASHDLVDEDRQINIQRDPTLSAVLGIEEPENAESLTRDDALQVLKSRMQSWYEIGIEGQDVVRKEGPLGGVTVAVEKRAEGKATTMITGFESFLVNAKDLAEEIRKMCATSTSVSSTREVLVQGKPVKAVTDLLAAKGIPQRWISSPAPEGGKEVKSKEWKEKKERIETKAMIQEIEL